MVKENGGTLYNYKYTNSQWGDQLTAIGSRAFTYDAIGNTLTDGKRTFTWKYGRQLATVAMSGATWTNTYNADGLRTKRTDGTNTYQYYYADGDLITMIRNSTKLRFAYTPDGLPYYVTYGGNYYIYALNLQGDVMAILNEAGEAVVEYTYDAWGNILSVTGSMASTLGQLNPLRYRGYVYDNETALYYLQSRYYDPEIGRFINADGQISSPGGEIIGNNMYAYCFNNPVNWDDPNGEWPKWLGGALNIVGGTAQMVAGAALGAVAGWTGVGAVAAGFLIVNGAATAAQGIGQVVNSVTNSNTMREDNIIRTGVTSTGQAVGGNTGGAIAGFMYDTAVMAANVYAGAAIRSPSACFVAGTAILTSVGSKAIEEIRVGDLVWSKNDQTGEESLKKVVQLFVRQSNELVYIYANGEIIETTPEHPFYVPAQGWTTAIALRVGDVLALYNGKYATIEQVYHETLEEPVAVYNFEVADFHTYYVGNNGALVHNTCQKFTPDQQAVIDLARESRNGLSRSEADTLVGWAKEYGIRYHGPMIHPNRSGTWGVTEHIKIFNLHIPVK